ncbi:MAG: hypothetical protein U1F43_32885 [Myxococcota bacterium]
MAMGMYDDTASAMPCAWKVGLDAADTQRPMNSPSASSPGG